MQLLSSYRLLELNDSLDWIPIGIAIPHEGEVGVVVLGRDQIRKIPVSGVDMLDRTHLWSDNLRWGPYAQGASCDDPRRLLAELIAPAPLREESVEEVLRRRATMEEVARLKEPVARTPQEALTALQRGNSRYFSGTSTLQNHTIIERRAQMNSQTPFAIVVGCSDSRVPVEIVFDQGPGNLFIVRVAGNLMGTSVLGSIEYGVVHLKSHLVVVLGHEGCGAVAASMLPKEARDREPEHIRGLLDKIVPATAGLPKIRDKKARMREAVVNNVRQQVQVLNQNPVIKSAVESGKIAVVGAFYSISSGGVDFYETAEDLAFEPYAVAEHAGAAH